MRLTPQSKHKKTAPEAGCGDETNKSGNSTHVCDDCIGQNLEVGDVVVLDS